MSSTLNIILKDLRRLRWPLAGWLLVMAAKYAVGFHLVLAADLPESSCAWGELRTAVIALGGVETALTFLIAVLAIHGDSVLGTRSFWMTRPISGARLLRAKLGGLALLLVGPAVLLPVPWWLVCGFGVGEIAAAMAEIAAWQALAIGIALVAGVLADSLGRVLVWTPVTLAVLAPPVVVGVTAWMRGPGSLGPLAALGIVVGTGAAVVMAQFLTRERRLAAALCGLGLAFAVAASGLWFKGAIKNEASGTPVETPAEVTRKEWNEALAREIVVEFRGAESWRDSRAADDTRSEFLRMTFAARGVPGGYVVGGVAMRHEWFGRSGLEHAATVRTYGRHIHAFDTTATRTLLGLPAWEIDPETERWEREQALARALRRGATQSVRDIANTLRERRPARPTEAPGDVQYVNTLVRAPSLLVDRLRETPTRFAMAASLDLVRPERWLETPLVRGSWTAGNARGVRVMRSAPLTVGRGETRIPQHHVALVESEPTGLLAKALEPLERGTNPLPESRYLVLNRTHATLAAPRVRGAGGSVTLGGVTVRPQNFEVNVPRVIRGGEWTEVPEWNTGARLVRLGWRPVAAFHRELQVETFELPPAPSAARQ